MRLGSDVRVDVKLVDEFRFSITPGLWRELPLEPLQMSVSVDSHTQRGLGGVDPAWLRFECSGIQEAKALRGWILKFVVKPKDGKGARSHQHTHSEAQVLGNPPSDFVCC